MSIMLERARATSGTWMQLVVDTILTVTQPLHSWAPVLSASMANNSEGNKSLCWTLNGYTEAEKAHIIIKSGFEPHNILTSVQFEGCGLWVALAFDI